MIWVDKQKIYSLDKDMNVWSLVLDAKFFYRDHSFTKCMYIWYICVCVFVSISTSLFIYQCIIDLDSLLALGIEDGKRYYIKSKSLTTLHFCSFCMLFKICLSAEADIRVDYFVLQGIDFAFLGEWGIFQYTKRGTGINLRMYSVWNSNSEKSE